MEISVTGDLRPDDRTKEFTNSSGPLEKQAIQDRGQRVGEGDNERRNQHEQTKQGSDRERSDKDQPHEHRAQPGKDREVTSPNRNSPTRAGSRDHGPGNLAVNKVVAQSEIKQRKSPKQPVLDEGQVLLLHEKISNKMTEIQTGLEKLRQKHTVLSGPKTQKEFYSRPVDLLEVYCEEDSQLTHRVNQSGGVALRFTKRDGDLSTEMGINKLWTWVEAYEPEHIWVAPECRLWGSSSRFNMGRSDTTKEKI